MVVTPPLMQFNHKEVEKWCNSNLNAALGFALVWIRCCSKDWIQFPFNNRRRHGVAFQIQEAALDFPELWLPSLTTTLSVYGMHV